VFSMRLSHLGPRGVVVADEGAALVEMALVSPLLLMLALGAGDFGRVMYASIVLSHAAHAGVQFGSQDVGSAANLADIEQAARDEARNIGTIGVVARVECERQDQPGTLVDCAETTCPAAYGEPRVFSEVTTTFTFQTLVPYPLIPNTVSLSRTARIRVQ
jgi:Flp pilus assembly protein TadG